jgi:hypothetical protein
MTNVFSLANMEKQYQITYDSKKEHVVIIHKENDPLKFTKGPENQQMNTTMVVTVDESKSCLVICKLSELRNLEYYYIHWDVLQFKILKP